MLALVALARKQFTDALDACDRAIAVLPDHAPFHATRARALLGARRYAEAEQSARRALALAPDDAATWTLIGRALLASDDLAGASASGTDAATGNLAGAEAAWRSALAIDATNAEAMFYLGNAARDRGDSAAAILTYEDALQHHPHDAQLLNNLGLALEASGDFDAARRRYEEALSARDAPVEAHANLARLLERLQDYPAAAAHYHAYATAAVDAPAGIWSKLALCQHRSARYAAEESYRKAPSSRRTTATSIRTRRGACRDRPQRRGNTLLARLRKTAPSDAYPRPPPRLSFATGPIGRRWSTSCARTSRGFPTTPATR